MTLKSFVKKLTLFYFLAVLMFLTSCSGINTQKIHEDFEVHTLYSNISNVHLVRYYDSYFLVDAGIEGEEVRIENQLAALGVNGKDLKFILLTHGHTDHAGTSKYFKETYGIPIIVGEGDLPMLLSGKNDSLCATSFLGEITRLFVPAQYPPVEPDVVVSESINLKNYGVDGTIIPMKDHTEGSLILVLEKTAFVGDLLRGKAMAKNTPALIFYQCDLEENQKNVIKTLLFNCDMWFTGHFGPLKTSRIQSWLESKPYN